MKKLFFLFLLASPLWAGYNTSLEIKKDLGENVLIISRDNLNWDYLEEKNFFEKRFAYSSLEINGENQTYYFSLGRKPLFKKFTKLFLGLTPLTEPLAVTLKGRAANFLDVSLGGRTFSRTVEIGSLEVRKLVFSLLKDADEDGLPDDQEYALYGAWPGLSDTDGDSIIDGEEVSLLLCPNMADSDGDGIKDCLDPHPLVPEFQLTFAGWSSHWTRVMSRKPQMFGDHCLSEENYLQNHSPFQGLGSGSIEFTPANIDCAEGGKTNYFSLTVFAEGSLTGLFLFSEEIEIIPSLPQLIPEEALPLPPEDMNALPFLARHGVDLYFTLIIKEPLTRNEKISILTSEGLRNETLGLTLQGGASPPPALLYPEDNCRLSQEILFSWEGGSADVTNYVLTISGQEYREFSTLGNSLSFLPSESGQYYWYVAAQGYGGESYSDIRSFCYLSPEENLDSDGDGFDDSEEKVSGSDPFDPRDIPQILLSGSLKKAKVDLIYSERVKVKGGIRPLRFINLSPLPFGISLKDDGLLCGVPSRKGTYPVKIMASDQLGRTLNMDFTLEVEQGGSGLLKLGEN